MPDTRSVLAPLAALSLAALPACYVRIETSGAGFHASGVGFTSSDLKSRVSATKTYPIDFEASGGTRKRLHDALRSGSCKVVVTDAEPRVELELIARGRKDEEAKELLEAYEGQLETRADEAVFTVDGTPKRFALRGGSVTISPTIRVVAHVPAGVALKVESGSGSIDVEGPFGTTELRSRYGNIHASDVHGGLIVDANSGKIRVERVSGGAVSLETNYGSVQASEVDAPRFEANSNSGWLRLEKIDSEILAKTAYGAIHAKKLRGSAVLQSSSGAILVEDARSALDLETQYGQIRAAGAIPSIRAHTSSGNIIVKCSPDAAPPERVDMSSDYGSLELHAPRDLEAHVDLSTSYGSVKTDFDVHTKTPAPRKSKSTRLRGRVGSNAKPSGRVKLESASGSVRLKRS